MPLLRITPKKVISGELAGHCASAMFCRMKEMCGEPFTVGG